jgi:DNA-binding transcriptional ArsR family regulator
MRKRLPNVAHVGPMIEQTCALIGDPTRARMLFALLAGREFSASELASSAHSSPQAASLHLGKLVEGKLLSVRTVGRQRLFRLYSAEVAEAIESLASIAPVGRIVSLTQQTTMQRLREVRSCYDHLAGRVGVGITDALLKQGAISRRDDSFHLTPRGAHFFEGIGIRIAPLRENRRALLRACTDWTERRPHVAGGLGAALLDRLLADGLLRGNSKDRALQITETGRLRIPQMFGVRFDI